MDPFEALGLRRSFDLGAEEIRSAYLARSAGTHPDVAAGGGGAEEGDAGRRMADLNRARRILEDPERRAEALLLALGGPAREQDRSLPEGFLMEIMETRQAIEEAVAGGDPAERRKWERWAEEERERAVREAGALFAGLSSPPRAGELKAIRTRLNAWRYIERLIEQLDPDYDPGRADFRDERGGGDQGLGGGGIPRERPR